MTISFEEYWVKAAPKFGGDMASIRAQDTKEAARNAWVTCQNQYGRIHNNWFYLKKLLDDLGDFLDDIEIDFSKFEWDDADAKEVWKEWRDRYVRRPKTIEQGR